MKSVTSLSLVFCILGHVNAQERTAAGAVETQMTWSALWNISQQANGNAKAAHMRIDKIAECGRQGMLYAPNNDGAGGCIQPRSGRSVPSNCDWFNLAQGQQQLICPDQKVLTGMAYEGGTWSKKNDTHAFPEIYSGLCCTIQNQ